MPKIADILSSINTAYSELTKYRYSDKMYSYEEVAEMLNPDDHAVMNVAKRPNKTADIPTGEIDEITGEAKTQVKQVEVCRLPVTFQQIILDRAVGFIYGNPIALKMYADDDATRKLFEAVENVLEDNKIDFKRKQRARLALSEMECAMLWYFVENANHGPDEPALSIKCKILSESLGDKLYPYYDEYGDMVAFSREYSVKVGDKVQTWFDIYTNDFTHLMIKDSGKLSYRDEYPTPVKNIIGKIPIIYYKFSKPVWHQSQKLIERYEERLSNTADTNDYNADPTILLKGESPTWFTKGERGKVMKTDADGGADVLSYDNMSESVKFELNELKSMIYSLTSTPDISFENMKNLGSNLSGYAISLMFIDAHMAAENRWETFGDMEQRELNLLKAMVGKVQISSLAGAVSKLRIKPVMTPYVPKNPAESVDILLKANGGMPIISQQSSIEESPFGYDATAEMELINKEADVMANRQNNVSGIFNA